MISLGRSAYQHYELSIPCVVHYDDKDVLYFSATQNSLDGFASASGGEFMFVKTTNALNWSLAEFGLPKRSQTPRLLNLLGAELTFQLPAIRYPDRA